MTSESDLFQIVPAVQDDLEAVSKFLQPFVDSQMLLPRTSITLQLLLRHGFKALLRHDHEASGCPAETLVGFVALEIYSKKLAEVQCLAVDERFRRVGIGKALVHACVDRAREEQVLELMAISNSGEMFEACGFDFSLPNQKRAYFRHP